MAPAISYASSRRRWFQDRLNGVWGLTQALATNVISGDERGLLRQAVISCDDRNLLLRCRSPPTAVISPAVTDFGSSYLASLPPFRLCSAGSISRGAATTLIPCDDDDRLRRRPQRPRDRFLAPAAVASSETRSSLVIGSAAISRRCLAWYVWGKGPCGGGSL
ncbi:hypothetical protein CLOM_g10926 [Closterium sp. NIES-68]|nr:hypothetical protein CLOM_g10926 [Closterium sp. NIES-68]